ncbi:MAG: cbb3-type cytochrome oxidase assembly protein CcoS [Chitinophagales bacterium]|nr:cbb3-type cytochrome oxidase assembly protein CcoS [Chitinophagales bacterium]
MTALILLISCSLLVAVGFLLSFLWSVKNGQYDDTYTPSVRMLFENELNEKQPAEQTASNNKEQEPYNHPST